MRRAFPGLRDSSLPADMVPEGLYLVRVRSAGLVTGNAKPYLRLEFEVAEPVCAHGRTIRSRLYCTPRALWKVQWLLRAFGYPADLVNSEEIDDKALRDLTGVIKVSHHDVNGRTFVNLDGFAPAESWRGQITLPRAG